MNENKTFSFEHSWGKSEILAINAYNKFQYVLEKKESPCKRVYTLLNSLKILF